MALILNDAKATLTNGQKSFVTKSRNSVEKEAPKRKFCPGCKQTRKIENFGVRTMKDKLASGGIKLRFALQSHCKDCR